MADRYEKIIKKYINAGKLTEEEAKAASSRAELIEKATNGAIKSANPKYTLLGSNADYGHFAGQADKYAYMAEDAAKNIVNGTRQSVSHNIWSQINSPTWSSNPQYTIEQLRGLKTGDTLLGLDVEAVGTPKFMGGEAGHFGITQVAAVPYQVDLAGNRILKKMRGDPVNILVKPDEETLKWLHAAIAKVADRTTKVPKLSAEEHRSLVSLIAYSGDARFGDAAGVILKTNAKAIPEGADLKPYLELIKDGLNKVENKAVSINEAFTQINQKMFNGGYKLGDNFKFFTTNGIGYDIPAIRELVGDLLPQGQGHIDLLQSIRTTYGDPYGAFYKGKGFKNVKGLLQLDNLFTAAYGRNMESAGLKAHYARHDVGGMGMAANKLLPGILDRVNGGIRTGGHNLMGVYGSNVIKNINGDNLFKDSVEYQMNTITNGMKLFSRGSSYRGSEIDTVIDMNSSKGVVRKFGPAIYRNRTYEVTDQFMQGDYYSVLLHNVEDDVYSVLGRKSKEELQSLMQKNFVPMEARHEMSYLNARGYSLYDSARREYESMFIGDSAYYKAKKYTEVARTIEKSTGTPIQNISKKDINLLLKNNSYGMTKTQARNFSHFYKRLGAESNYIEGMVNAIDSADLDSNGKNLAMENFKREFEAQTGEVTKDLKLPSHMNQVELFVPGPKGGMRKGVDATNFNTLEAGIRSILTGGVRESSMNFSNVVDNFDQVVSDLVGQGLISKEKGRELVEAGRSFLSNSGNKTEGVTYLSSLLTHDIGGKLSRVNTISKVADLKSTTHIVNGLKEPSALYSNAIESAKGMLVYSKKGAVLSQAARDSINSYYVNDMKKLQSKYGLKSDNFSKSIASEIEDFADKLYNEDIRMNVYSGSQGLQLALYDKKHAKDVMRNGVKSSHVALVNVPLSNNGMLINGGTNKANIMYAIEGRDGRAFMSTAQQQVMFNLKNTSKSVAKAFKTGNIGEATRLMNKSVQRSLEPLSSLTVYSDVADELYSMSRGANYIRTSIVNISPLIDKYLDKHEAGLDFANLKLRDKNNLIRDIIHGAKSDGKYRTEYGEGIKKALDGLNIHVGLEATKTELIAGGMFSDADARWLIPFGSYAGTTREVARQAQNYYALDKNLVDVKNTRRINPQIMTDVAQDVYSNGGVLPGEINGLMVKTANVDDITIKRLLGDQWDALGAKYNLTTYEAQAFMREDVAKQFGAYERKELRIVPGSGLIGDQSIIERLSNGQVSVGRGQKITLGTVVRESTTDGKLGNPLGHKTEDMVYKSKYGSVIRGYKTLEDGTLQFDIDELMPSNAASGRGFKLISEGGFDKATINVLTEEEWAKLPEALRNAEMVFSGATFRSPKRPPAATISSELNLAIADYLDKNVKHLNKDGVTVGSLTRAEAEADVVKTVTEMLGFSDGIGFKNYSMEHGMERVLTLPALTNQYRDISWTKLNKALGDLGVSQGEVRYGLTQFRRARVNEYPEFIGTRPNKGSKFKGIHWGTREMEMIESRMDRWSALGGPDISALYGTLKEGAYNFSPVQMKENRGLLYVSQLLRNGKLNGEFNVLNPEDLKSLRQISVKPAGNPLEDFTDSILDSKLANGKEGFILNLPMKVEVGSNKKGRSLFTDKLFMPSMRLDNKYVDGVVQPSKLQSYQLGLYREISSYSDLIKRGEYELAEESRNSIANLANKYILQSQKDLLGSKGSLVRESLENNLKNSGRTIAQGKVIAGLFDENGKVIADKVAQYEGRVGISAMDMRKSLAGISKNDIKELIDLAGGDSAKAIKGKEMDYLIKTLSNPDSKGLYGIIGRNPTIGEGSVMAARYYVDTGIKNRASSVTVGLMTSLRADHDGDYYSHLFAWFDGEGKDRKFNKDAYLANAAWYNKEESMVQRLGTQTLESFSDDLKKEGYYSPSQIAEKIGDRSVDDDTIRVLLGDKFAERLTTEARLGKTVGSFSNASLILRSQAQTVGNYTNNQVLYGVVSTFGEQLEQKSISFKKLEELLDKASAPGTNKEDYLEEYISAIERLRDTDLRNFDMASIIKDAKTIGIFDDKGNFTGHYRIQLEEKLNGKQAGVGEFVDALTQIKKYYSKGIDDPQSRALVSEPYTIEAGLQTIDGIMNNPKPLQNVKRLREATGLNLSASEYNENLAQTILNNSEYVGNKANEIPVSEFIGGKSRTVGDDAAEKIFGSVGKAFKNANLGGAGMLAAGVLGAWALTASTRAPNIEQQPVEARSDQAPSSDGSYVNTARYAVGAPAGAGPTPYLSAKGTGYEKLTVNIRGDLSNGMSNEDVAQLIQGEIQSQTGIGINLNISSEDNRDTINMQWLQNQFASALKTGYVAG
jgi:polyhydroxyalkanoate synthesis regulator phasin